MAASDLWSLVSPFVAAGTAVWLARRQDRERLGCFVDWSSEYDDQRGYYEWLYVGIHNRSANKIVLRSVRFLTGSFPRKLIETTALRYDDPFDLSFPYHIEPGQVLTLALDCDDAVRIVRKAPRWATYFNKLIRRPRIAVECITTGGTKLRSSAEEALPWDERIHAPRNWFW